MNERRADRSQGGGARLGVVLVLGLGLMLAMAWLLAPDGTQGDGGGAVVGPLRQVRQPSHEPLAAVEPNPARDMSTGSWLPHRIDNSNEASDASFGSGVLHGRVFRRDGEPLAGATITMDGQATAAYEATSDGAGRWSLALDAEARPFSVSASATGFAADRRGLYGFDPGSVTPAIDFVLSSVLEVTGVVRWDDGDPCPLAKVSIAPGAPMQPNLLRPALLAATTADVDGVFSLTLGRGQAVRASVTFKDHGPFEPFLREVPAEGEDKAHWEFVLTRPAALAIEVRVEPDRAAELPPDLLEGAKLSFGVMDSLGLARWQRRGSARLVDRRARFEGLDPRSSYGLGLAVRGYEPIVLAWAVTPERPERTVVVTLPELVPIETVTPAAPPERRGDVWWRVVDGDGEVVSRAEAQRLLPVTFEAGELVAGHAVVESLASGERQDVSLTFGGSQLAGHFTLLVEPPCRVTAEWAGERIVLETVVSGQTVDIPLRVPTDRYDVVLCPIDDYGRRVVCTLIELWDEASGVVQLVLPRDSDGTYPARLGAGRYEVRVRPNDGRPAVRSAIEIPAPNPDGLIELLVPVAGGLRGTVSPPPERDTSLQLIVTGAVERWTSEPSATQVFSDGRFEVASLSPGTKRLTLWRRGPDGVASRVAEAEATVEPGRVTELNLLTDVVEAGRVVTLTPSLRPMGPAWIEREGGGFGFMWLMRGAPESRRLPVGTYSLAYARLRARSQDGGSPRQLETVTFEVPPGDGPLRLTLP